MSELICEKRKNGWIVKKRYIIISSGKQGASSCRFQQLIDYWKNLNEMEFIISGILRVLS